MTPDTSAEIKADIKEQYKDSAMSKTGRLAMELSAEKARLRQEMVELQVQVEDLSPATPTGTVDSYVKWVATITCSFWSIFQSAGFMTEGKIAYALSSDCLDLCWACLE